MNITESIKKPVPEQKDINEALADWPKHYYEETDPAFRLKLLEASIELGNDPERDAIRKEIFHLRYHPNSNTASGFADSYMGCFMHFVMVSKSGVSPLGRRSARKKALKELKATGWGQPHANQELYDALLIDEYTHVGLLYIALSADSKQYNALIFGFGKISEGALIRKLYKDLSAAGKDAAEILEMKEEMKSWILGLERARARLIPDTDPFI